MGETLIDKYKDWKGVCNYYAELLKARIPKFDKSDFINWMMKQKDYSKSNYKKGLFCDLGLYYHCYLIYKKVNGKNNQHHMILICGKIGKGKSTLGLQIGALCDSTFNMERVCYVPPHLFRRLSRCNYGESNIIDEGGNFFKSRNSMTKLGRDISQAFQLVRDLRQVLIVCYDEPEKLDKELIDKFDTMLVKLYDSNAKGDSQYKNYLAFNVKALDKIKPLLKKKIPVTDNQIKKYASWKGHNSIEIPILNDITEQIYRKEKRKYLRDHMENLADKYKEEFEGLDKTEAKTKVTMKIPQFAKAKGVSVYTIRNWIRNGTLKADKIGRDWLIDIKSIES